MQVGVQFYQTFLVKADDAVPDFFEVSSWLVREAIRLLLNTFPITLSKERTWGLSVSGVLVFEWEGDWQGVFGVALSVKETRSEVRVERVEVDLPFIADTCWLIFDEFDEISIKSIEWEDN